MQRFFHFIFYFFVVGVQTRELERPATVMIYGSKPILGVSILALYLCMADNKLNSTTTVPTLISLLSRAWRSWDHRDEKEPKHDPKKRYEVVNVPGPVLERSCR